MSLTFRPLSAAVLLSQSARPLYSGMLRPLALFCGAACFRAPGAWRRPGLRQLCNERVRRAQVRDPQTSLVRLVESKAQDPHVNEVVCNLHPAADECLELPHGDVGGCSVRQVDHGEEPVSVDVLDVSPEGCDQPARGCVGVDVVDCPQFLSVNEVRVSPLCLVLGCGGGMVSQSWSGVVPAGEGCPGAVSRCPAGTLFVEGSCFWGHRTGRGGGRGAIGLRRAGGLCHFFVRSRVACVVPLLLWCVLRVPVVWLRCSQGGRPRGTWPRVRWPLPESGAGAATPCLWGGGGGGESFVPQPPAPVTGRLRVPLAACPRRSVPPAADRPVTLGGRRRTSWTHRLLPGG